MQLFGTAGIRGITNSDITPELGVMMGLAYGTVFSGKIAIARDTRYGAEMLQNAVMAGLASTGAEVYNLGIVPLPVFARYVADKMDGGIIITGSHTPPEILGIVAVDSLGRDLYWDISEEIEKIYQTRDFKRVDWKNVKDSEQDDAVAHYMNFIEPKAKGIDGYRILVDLANGAGAGVVNKVLEELGVEVECMNCMRLHIPARPSEPRRTTLTEMIGKSGSYDFAAGMDVDADRVVFAHGVGFSEDTIGAIFATRFAKSMVTPINSSSLVEYISSQYGIKVHYCPIGPPEIAEALLRTGAEFGYEETGKYIFPPDTLWGDSMLSMVNMMKIMNSEGKSIDELVAEFPKFYQLKEKIKVPRSVKRKVVELIKEELLNSPPVDANKIVTVDGVKIVYDDAWLLIRPSGTEDVIRVFADGSSEKKVRALVEMGKKMVLEKL
ncbi:MAG: phosphoglucomutase [Euryarchaeota archaeon]|nr:phosphoglucomutase [Euryarchaeota archaeon]